ncbi:MAG: hypothetical protein R3D01_05375 [Hyphomicrobiales bacterium]
MDLDGEAPGTVPLLVTVLFLPTVTSMSPPATCRRYMPLYVPAVTLPLAATVSAPPPYCLANMPNVPPETVVPEAMVTVWVVPLWFLA